MIKDPRKKGASPWYMDGKKLAAGSIIVMAVIAMAICATFNVGPGFMPWNDKPGCRRVGKQHRNHTG